MKKEKSKIGIVFPGQGSQKLGMLKAYYDNFDDFKNIFKKANDILNVDIWDIIQNNKKKLNNTVYTQPAMFVSNVATWQVLKNKILRNYDEKNIIICGHSLGEFNALTAAKSLSFTDGLQLIQKRAQLMQHAVSEVECEMAAILSISTEQVIECCKQASDLGVVEPSNFNSHKQTVIAGQIKAVRKAILIAKKMGGRSIILPISIPSHCSLMKKVVKLFTLEISKVEIKSPCFRVMHNYNAKHYNSGEDIKKVLVKQLYSPVQWVKIIESMKQEGVQLIIECGPGRILNGINKQIIKKHIRLFNIPQAKDVETLKIN